VGDVPLNVNVVRVPTVRESQEILRKSGKVGETERVREVMEF